MGTSIKPGLVILPVSEKHLVPAHFGVPVFANHAPPFWMISGMLANVSTFWISVGFCHKTRVRWVRWTGTRHGSSAFN